MEYNEIKQYTDMVQKLRVFFLARDFLEIHTQNRLSILAACEDPSTIATFDYTNQTWPLPQTGQMWLEHELLSNPTIPGLFCLSTSYRNEPNPVKGRHDLIFPMFEFETHGNMDSLIELETDLLRYLHIGMQNDYWQKEYNDMCVHYDTDILDHEHEEKMCADFGPVGFLKNFPYNSQPFWNMKKVGNVAKKVDVIINGMETIGSAERATDPMEMRKQFLNISNGMYAKTLLTKFGTKRVAKELDKFLNFNFFTRCGGGIGLTRLMRAFK